MELIPAIDLLGGQVVRLRQGRFEDVTVFSDDPPAVASRWAGEGATRLHLVDLDGARSGSPTAWPVVDAVVAAVSVPVQLAGGIRTDADVERALASGVDRVVLGTVLLRDAATAPRLVRRFGPERIVAALDVRDGQAVGQGWVAGAVGEPAEALARRLRQAGIATFAVTAIARDGVLGGPDIPLLARMAREVGAASLIASGGVSTVDDVRALARAGFGGAILGRALYEDRLDLREAIEAVRALRGDGV
jgi:phosphoribosylformimino-5-aminoimidazole carboxamide ribotide isomerase